VDAQMEREMLKKKELEDLIQRQKEEERKRMALQAKYNIQNQMEMKAKLRQEAYQEYLKEKESVDKVISKMIEED
jgi:membrane-anchored protein YejM (alkaline phosphatase superfamily)